MASHDARSGWRAAPTGRGRLWTASPPPKPAYAATMQPDDLEPRVTALEGQVRNLREEVRATKIDVAALRDLASAVARDVSAMRGFRRATTASINALREDMVDMRGEIVDMRGEMSSMRQEMRTKFDLAAAGQQRIVALLQQVLGTPGGGTAPA